MQRSAWTLQVIKLTNHSNDDLIEKKKNGHKNYFSNACELWAVYMLVIKIWEWTPFRIQADFSNWSWILYLSNLQARSWVSLPEERETRATNGYGAEKAQDAEGSDTYVVAGNQLRPRFESLDHVAGRQHSHCHDRHPGEPCKQLPNLRLAIRMLWF